MSCTTKQHWEVLIDAGVVIGEGGDEEAITEGDVGGGEIVMIRGNGTDTRGEVGLARGDGLAVFDENGVDSVVVPGVSVGGGGGELMGGGGDETMVFEDEYGDPIVTVGVPET